MLVQKGEKFKLNGYDCEIIDVVDEKSDITYVGKVSMHDFNYVIIWNDDGTVQHFERIVTDETKFELKPKPELPKVFVGEDDMAIQLEYRGKNDNHICMCFGSFIFGCFTPSTTFSCYYTKHFKSLLRDVEDWLEHNATKTEDGWYV